MFKFYPCNLNQRQKFDIISDINFLFDTGNWYHYGSTPRYQTKPDLHKMRGSHWQFVNDSLVEGSQKLYDLTPAKMKCWCYKSFPYVESEYSEKSWHHHYTETTASKAVATAIMYLHLPKNSNGTEYITDNNTIEFMPIVENAWIFFPVDLVHRPGFWDNKNMCESRMVLAAIIFN